MAAGLGADFPVISQLWWENFALVGHEDFIIAYLIDNITIVNVNRAFWRNFRGIFALNSR